jgi:hypothetical protein
MMVSTNSSLTEIHKDALKVVVMYLFQNSGLHDSNEVGWLVELYSNIILHIINSN